MANNISNIEQGILNSLNNIEMVAFSEGEKMINQNKNILDNARLSNKFNIDIPYTQTSPPLTPTYIFNGNNKGNILYSIALNYDITNTQPNYSFLIEIDGVAIDSGTPNSNGYTLLPKSGGYNPIPEGNGIRIKGNCNVKVYAYMSGSTTTDGSFSISILSEVL